MKRRIPFDKGNLLFLSKVIMMVSATIVGILAILLIQMYPNDSNSIFGIELLLLPLIYIIGGMVSENLIENLIKEKYQKDLDRTEELYDKLYSQYEILVGKMIK